MRRRRRLSGAIRIKLRHFLRSHPIEVLALHVGFVDTDLTHGIDVPKANPLDVVKATYDALASGKHEIMADPNTAALKLTLADEVPGYIAYQSDPLA